MRDRSQATLTRRPAQGMLVAILMITAATLAIALAVATMSSSEVNISQVAKQGDRADSLAHACLENALMRLARTETSEPPSFTVQDGNCTIKITGSGPYEIQTVAQVGRAFRELQATVSVDNEVLNITQWQEIY